MPLFFSSAVTNSLLLPVLLGCDPLPPKKSPFSRSASTQGPDPAPEHENQHSVPKLSASMWPLPVSLPDVSALP